MAITTYSELKTAVANWLNDATLTSRIPEFIAMAEDRLYQEVRIRPMETTGNLTISAQTVSLPTGFVGVRRLYLNVSSTDFRRLDYYAPEDFWTRSMTDDSSGTPRIFTIEGENIVVGPTPDTTYTGKLLYWKRLTALSGDSDTNWFLTNARGLLLYGALVEASVYLEDDPRALTWATLYDDLIEKVKRADKRDRFPSAAQSHSEVNGP